MAGESEERFSLTSIDESFDQESAAQFLIRDARTPPPWIERLRELALAVMPTKHAPLVDRVCGTLGEVCGTSAVRNTASLLWILLRFTICIHVAWLLGWLLLVLANGGIAPNCGEQCTIALRNREPLPWQTPDTFFFYIFLYISLLAFSYYKAAQRWLCGRQPLLPRLTKTLFVILLVPAFLNIAFWKVVVTTYANVSYLDWDPSIAARDAARPRPVALSLPNGTVVPLSANDIVLVGNGPLAAEHRIFIRGVSPGQLYRFNGMTNLLPDEPVGHLFVRRVNDFATSVLEFPGEYWGLAPPLRRAGLLEMLYLPAGDVVRRRTMCHRALEAVDITLLRGQADDATYYAWHYGVNVRLPECDGLCREAPPTSGRRKAPGGWTSGFLGLLEVLELHPSARIHLLGMNFGAAPNQQHATHIEKRFVETLIERGRVVVHRSPSGLYHSEFLPTRQSVAHIGLPTRLFVTDARVQGMSCGAWNVWWFLEWQWSPLRWYHGVWPLPPFFHQGTELHLADAAGNALPPDYDPLNCTQHIELLTLRSIGSSPGGRRLSARFSLRRLVRWTTGIKLYGGAITSNVSLEFESLDECEERVGLIRRFEDDFRQVGSAATLPASQHPSAPAMVVGAHGDAADGGGGGGGGGGGDEAHGASANAEGHQRGGHGGHGAYATTAISSNSGGDSGTRHASGVQPSVNTSHFHHHGYVIVDDVFASEYIDWMRQKILQLQANESTHFKPWFVPESVDPGVTIPNFLARPSFNFMHDLPSAPQLLAVLRTVFGGSRFRYCSHNDIGIDRIVGWHKDVLNDQYKKYQSLPLWETNAPEGGHFIVKALVYLQDHTKDDDALVLVPGSHTTPSMDTEGHITLHPKKGSVVVFEQRATHRGRYWTPQKLLHNDPSRILVSLGYGRDNIFTGQFERGTRARQANQCGAKCVPDQRPSGVAASSVRKLGKSLARADSPPRTMPHEPSKVGLRP